MFKAIERAREFFLSIFGFAHSLFNIRTTRVFGSAGFIAIVIGLLFALYEVQEWNMPDFLAIPILVILLAMLFIAISIIFYESAMGIKQYVENRSTTAEWISDDMPGVLDCQVDGPRARKRFSEEIDKLPRSLGDLEKTSVKYKHVMEELSKQSKNVNAQSAKNKANKVTKYLNSTEMFIHEKSDPFQVLVMDITRNYEVMAQTWNEDNPSARSNVCNLVLGFKKYREAAVAVNNSLNSYKKAIEIYVNLNLTRDIRESGKRLIEEIDALDSIFKDFKIKCDGLVEQLKSKFPNLDLSIADKSYSGNQ